jgi:hypothetical protein
MTPKQLMRIVAVLAAAVLLWGLAVIVRGGGDEVERVTLFGPYVEEQIDQVEITGPGDTIVLVRTGATWQVNGFEADPVRVRTFFQQMAVPIEGELAARSASSHERMGVDETSGKRFRVLQGGQPVADVVVGNNGRTYRSVYVRISQQDPVYLIEGELTGAFTRPLKDWRDKRIVTLAADAIGGIEFVRGDSTFGIQVADDGWVFGNDTPTDSAAVSRFLEKFNPLLSQGVMFATLAQVDSIDFGTPDRRLTISDIDGEMLSDLLFVETESGSGYWVREAAGELVFQLMTYKVNEIVPMDVVFQPKVDSTAN